MNKVSGCFTSWQKLEIISKVGFIVYFSFRRCCNRQQPQFWQTLFLSVEFVSDSFVTQNVSRDTRAVLFGLRSVFRSVCSTWSKCYASPYFRPHDVYLPLYLPFTSVCPLPLEPENQSAAYTLSNNDVDPGLRRLWGQLWLSQDLVWAVWNKVSITQCRAPSNTEFYTHIRAHMHTLTSPFYPLN